MVLLRHGLNVVVYVRMYVFVCTYVWDACARAAWPAANLLVEKHSCGHDPLRDPNFEPGDDEAGPPYGGHGSPTGGIGALEDDFGTASWLGGAPPAMVPPHCLPRRRPLHITWHRILAGLWILGPLGERQRNIIWLLSAPSRSTSGCTASRNQQNKNGKQRPGSSAGTRERVHLRATVRIVRT